MELAVFWEATETVNLKRLKCSNQNAVTEMQISMIISIIFINQIASKSIQIIWGFFKLVTEFHIELAKIFAN